MKRALKYQKKKAILIYIDKQWENCKCVKIKRQAQVKMKRQCTWIYL